MTVVSLPSVSAKVRAHLLLASYFDGRRPPVQPRMHTYDLAHIRGVIRFAQPAALSRAKARSFKQLRSEESKLFSSTGR